MIKQYFIQAWAQLRQQPLISAVSIAGTALSIFLIMLVVMMQQVKVAPFAPESNRDRFLHVRCMSIGNKSWGTSTSNGPMSVQTARECFQSLTTPEAVTIYSCLVASKPVSLPGQSATGIDLRETDDVFWHVFDFAFTDGKPYDKATFDAAQPVAVITESVSRVLFGTTKSVGREFLLGHAPYRVAGVVKDVSTLATTCYGQVWVPFTSTGLDKDVWSEGHMGMMSCTILARSRADFPKIREEVERRRLAYNTQIGEDGWELIYRNRPYDQEKNSIAYAANYEPDLKAERRERLIIFIILLIVPAINLSSMTQSRLRQRVSEVGVRRAFGCTRTEMLGQILAENLVVTLAAGIFGLLLSIAFAYLGNTILFAQPYSATVNPPAVDASILLHASTFGWALLFCFILNLLSSGLPAWRASRIGIVNALGGKLY
ncbi:MAG: ABC transporter permease [Bacteroides sp.]|nr:ABC transporter permease [Bacteroides sp.]